MTNPQRAPVVESVVHWAPGWQVIPVDDPTQGRLLVKRALADGDTRLTVHTLRNEQRILERLRGTRGCPRLVWFDPARRELAVEDFGGIPASQAGQLGLADFLRLAEALAGIVAAIHAQGVIQKAIRPANILVRRSDLDPQIFDFGLATTFAEEHPEFGPPSHLLGDLAYLSPEQTGRMNRPVDYRTDLYSLGATLYALATGHPPFEDTDPLGLIHAHLARSPRPPAERASWLPPCVSAAILTLLAKEPDDRYQSAVGLAYDLGCWRQALAESRPLERVPLKQRDFPLVPRPPHRLYGREDALATLTAAFASAVQGRERGLFVTGYAGIGKTALIKELYRPVTLSRGWFVGGKFEQFQQGGPFLAPSQCLRQLCQLLLAEPEAVAADWRHRLLAGIGPDVAALFAVVPELEALLGPQPPVPELGPVESLTRLRGQLVALLREIAAPDRPLVLFLDDLQWADPASLEFVGALLDEPRLDGLFLLGAYRDNEVDAAHLLAPLLRRLTALGNPLPVLHLGGLTVEHLAALLADMLGLDSAAVRPLAAALSAKTDGNPFFAIELLKALHQDGALRVDPQRMALEWDLAVFSGYPASANVVDFLVERLGELDPQTADLLAAAACLGNECSLELLALATGIDLASLPERLMAAMESGLLVTRDALAFQQAEPGIALRFGHDRLQQAVYQLRDPAWRARKHLDMARRFVQAGSDLSLRLRAAEHYALAVSLIGDAAERASVRALFLNAAMQARQAGAFELAERYLRLGLELSPGDLWDSEPAHAFDVHRELHLVLYSLACYQEADDAFAWLDAHASPPAQLLEPACVQVMSLSNRTRYDEAIQLGSGLLARFDVAVPEQDLPSQLERELDRFYRYVESGALDRLSSQPTPADARPQGVAKLMNRMIPAAFFCNPRLACWLTVRCGCQWIEEGYQEFLFYPTAGIILASIASRGDYATGFRAASAALAIGLAGEHAGETARVQHVMGLLNSHWFRPLEDSLAHARAAFGGLMRVGELEFACYTFFTSLAVLMDTASTLADVEAEVHAALVFAHKTGNQHGEQSFLAYRQLIRTLQGRTATPGNFDDTDFDERAHAVAIQGNPMARCFFHVYRALAAALFDDGPALIHHAEAAHVLAPYITAFYPTALVDLLHSLALTRQFPTTPEEGRPALLARLADNQAWLQSRAADAPANFAHLYDWVEAERLDVLDQPWQALGRFEDAMRKVQGGQRPWHLALLTERAGRCYLRRGLEYAGRPLLARSHDLYCQWGAEGKARALRAEWPFIDAGPGNVSDQQALLLASQALSSETSLPCLVARVVERVGELAGATDVRFLVRDEAGCWYLEGGVWKGAALERMPVEEAERQGIVSGHGMRLALKTRQPVCADDAVTDNRFAGDPHFAGLARCSFLALPVLAQGRLGAFLVLENQLFRGAFTATKVEHVSLLCAQLAISIENIRRTEQLLRANLELAERARKISVLNAELARRAEQAEAANRAKNSFLANMSHEIRTPLNAVLGLTHLLTQDGVTPRQRDRLIKIEAAGRHLLGILNNILDFARLEVGKLQLTSESSSLTALLEQVRRTVEDAARAKGLTVTLACEDVPSGIQGDLVRLQQALRNYASNAVKFTEQGTIVLGARLVAEEAEELVIRFEVQDTGIGIAPDRLEHLFQPFVQVDGSTTRRYGGTGLGLALTAQLAQLMGGETGAESTLGQGSCFWFTARLARGQESAAPRALPLPIWAAERALRECHAGTAVLLVEDDPINRAVTLALLEAVGLRVDTAPDGEAALGNVQVDEYALILMDLQTVRMDGLAAARAIRSLPGWQTKPILALTAHGEVEDRQACLAAGMNEALHKPVEPRALFAALLRWLSEPQARPNSPPLPSLAESAHTELALVSVDRQRGLRVRRELMELLDSGDVRARQFAQAEASLLQALVGERYVALVDCLMQFEFDGAREILATVNDDAVE